MFLTEKNIRINRIYHLINSRVTLIPACDGQTDGQTFGDSIDRAINSDVGVTIQ